MTAEELLREWDERDRAASWVPSDERVWRDVGALRLLCVELLLAAPHSGSDLYHACIRLGGTLSDRGATPTLAAVALDGARDAFAAKGRAVPDLTWLYFAIAQFPIYLMPSMLKPLARRVAPPPAP